MSTLVLPMASPGIKRSLEDDDGPPVSETATIEMADSGVPSVEPGSPLSSVGSVPSRVPDGLVGLSTTQTGTSTSSPGAPNPKRRKLTAAEKEAARVEKEDRAREKALQQAQREAEKEAERQRRLEEKKQRDEEKEEKRRVKEAEKAAKDHERALKEQDRKEKQEKRDAEKKAKEEEKKAIEDAKAKKAASQMRLTGFFSKPRDSSPNVASRSRTASVDPQEDEKEGSSKTPVKTKAKPLFLPFAPGKRTTWVRHGRNTRDEAATRYMLETMDSCLWQNARVASDAQFSKHSLASALCPPLKRPRYTASVSVKEIIEGMRGSASQPVDLTRSTPPVNYREALRNVRVKSFKYKEDVRPPYIGTHTKLPDRCSLRELSRRPFKQASSNVMYDYDSEAEWDEPEEGEDLVSEGDEDPEDDDGEDMDGFLDDEEAEGVKRPQLLGDMEPIFTPIHWVPLNGSADINEVPFGNATLDLRAFQIETLLEEPMHSIDPFSTEYWSPACSTTTDSTALKSSSNSSAMPPPSRIPLNSIPGATNIVLGKAASNGQIDSLAKSGKAQGDSTPAKSNKAGRPAAAPLPADLLEAFKAAIKGSTLTKVGLIEVLKSQFPSVSKSTVQETLEQVAERVGAKSTDKQWVLKSAAES